MCFTIIFQIIPELLSISLRDKLGSFEVCLFSMFIIRTALPNSALLIGNHKFLMLYLPGHSAVIVPNSLSANSNYQQLSQNEQNIYQPPFLERGALLAGSKTLALSEGECLPKPAIFYSCSRAQHLSRPLIVPFLVLLLILIHAIRELLLTRPVLNLELFELQVPLLPEPFEPQQIVHPAMLSQLREIFELLHELLHMLIAVLHALHVLHAHYFRRFRNWLFLYLIDYVVFDAMVLNQIKNMGFCCTNSWGYSKMDSDSLQQGFSFLSF